MEIITEPNTNYVYKLKVKKAKDTWTIFWTVLWVSLTCVALVVLDLTHATDKIINLFIGLLLTPNQRKLAKFLHWIPGLKKLAMNMVIKDEEDFAKKRQVFYETCIFLVLVKMVAGLILGGMVDLFRVKFKASDFWRLVMMAIRIYILMSLLEGCNTGEMAKKLEKKHIVGVIMGNYCLSAAWDLIKDMGTLTVTDIFSKVMSLWVLNATISETKPGIVVMIGKIIAEWSNWILNSLKDMKEGKVVFSIDISKPVEDVFGIVATPIFCIFLMMFLLVIIKRIEQFVNKELGIPKKVVAAWSVILCIVLGAFFILHGYKHLDKVVSTLKDAAGRTSQSLQGPSTDNPNQTLVPGTSDESSHQSRNVDSVNPVSPDDSQTPSEVRTMGSDPSKDSKKKKPLENTVKKVKKFINSLTPKKKDKKPSGTQEQS